MQSTLTRHVSIQTAELLVLWQNLETREMIPVGVLGFDGKVYNYRYLPSVTSVPGFRPFLGFRDLKKTYISETLFPLFGERALEPKRPDFERYIDAMDLDAESASPWEILVRSGGKTEGDTLQLTPFPVEYDHVWQFRFMVAGVRHLQRKSVCVGADRLGPYSADEHEQILADINIGDELDVVAEIGNAYEGKAQLLRASGGHIAGYIPQWLVDLARGVGIDLQTARVVVEHSNDSAAGWHLRLLVRLEVETEADITSESMMKVLDAGLGPRGL